MKSGLVFIAPYKEMADMVQEVCDDLNLNWTVDVGNLEYGLLKAKRYVSEDAKVIVSRSGTAALISQYVHIPVLDIGYGAYDIVLAVSEARNFGRKIGIIGFSRFVYNCSVLSEPLGVEITELIINSDTEIPMMVSRAKQEGLEVILGGINSRQCAIENGLYGICFTSGKSTISTALLKAQEILDLQHREKIHSNRLKKILDFSYEGILLTDKNDNILLMNKTAQTMLGVKGDSVVGSKCYDIVPFTDWENVKKNGIESIGNLLKVGKNYLVHNISPVISENEVTGMVMSFQDTRNIEDIESKVRKELRLNGHVAVYHFENIITKSQNMLQLIQQAKKYARVDSTVLITGQTGTGKELIAQSIHNESSRRNSPFVAINCASIPHNLLESALFGYEDGAFTGARKNGKKGYFELANGGTLFLDEIGEIPQGLQANFLRVLQEKEIIRVGGDKVIPINVRIIAATHRNLYELTKEGTFRSDLFHRLNVLRLSVPPLNQRLEDIPVLAELFMNQKSEELSLKAARLHPDTIEKFKTYIWEGNVRELENVIERILILKSGQNVYPEDLENLLADIQFPAENKASSPVGQAQFSGTLEELERQFIIETLKKCGNNCEKACVILGISPSTLRRRIKEWNIA